MNRELLKNIIKFLAQDPVNHTILHKVFTWVLDDLSITTIQTRFLEHYKMQLLAGEKPTIERFMMTPTWRQSKNREQELLLFMALKTETTIDGLIQVITTMGDFFESE